MSVEGNPPVTGGSVGVNLPSIINTVTNLIIVPLLLSLSTISGHQ